MAYHSEYHGVRLDVYADDAEKRRLLCRGSGRTLFVYFNMSEEYMKSKKGNFWLLCVEVTFFQRFISDIFSCSQNTQTGQWHPEYL